MADKVRLLVNKLKMTESAAGLITKDQRITIVEDQKTKYIIEVDKEDVNFMKSRYGAVGEINE